jgi:hypothetical protein
MYDNQVQLLLSLTKPVLGGLRQTLDVPATLKVVALGGGDIYQTELGLHRRCYLRCQGWGLRNIALGDVIATQGLVVKLAGQRHK